MCDLFTVDRHPFSSLTHLRSLRFMWLYIILLLLISTACGPHHARDKTMISKDNEVRILVEKNPLDLSKSRVLASTSRQINKKRSSKISRAHLAPTRRAAHWVYRAQTSHGQKNPSKHQASEHQASEASEKIPIAVILPLTGRYHRWGKAIQAAFKNSARTAPHISWHFLDSGSDRSVAVAKTERAVHHLKVKALIGPLSPWSSAAVSARARWYELPWFALGSFPPSMRHPFSFSWRLEAKDVASSLSQSICQYRPDRAHVLTDQRPRSQLTAQRLIKLLNRCGVKGTEGQVITRHNTRQIKHPLNRLGPDDLDRVIDKIEPPRAPSHIGDTRPRRRGRALIILARGVVLNQTLQRLIDQSQELRSSMRRRSWELNIYTGLGVNLGKQERALNSIANIFALERASLSERGQRHLDTYPKSSTLALEIFDLSLWLERAVRLSSRHQIKLSEALNSVKSISGVWGQREVRQGRLTPTPLSIFALTP